MTAGKSLVSEQVQATAEDTSSLSPPVPVLYAPAYQSTPDVATQVGLVEDGLRTAGVNSVVIPSACAFSDDENFGYWMDVKARQTSESVRRLRKQVLTGVVTLVREVCGRRPRLLIGAQQGALIVLMASLPLVVEAALRGRVSTEVELVEARNTWCALEGYLGIVSR